MRTIIFSFLSLFVICTAAPSDPIPRTDEYWIGRHEEFRLNTANNPDIPIIFYGDSITARWITENGAELFERYYAPLGVANYGIGADQIQNVLYRIVNGEVEGLDPKLVVLKVGTNNLDSDSNQPLTKGIVRIVFTLRQLLPNTKILLLGILPRNGVTYFDRIVQINSVLSTLDDRQHIFFLDMFNDFWDGDVWGVVPTYLFQDGLHLTVAGYQHWHDTMAPLFNELIQ